MCIENLRLVLFQLRSRVALGIDQGLLALIVGGREVLVGFRDFDVIAKDRVELHLEGSDSSAFSLTVFHLGQILFGIAAQVTKVVEVFVYSGRDYAAIAQR